MTDNPLRVADDASGDVRVIVTAGGQHWVVREVELSTYDRRTRSLVFLTDGAMRRVRNYPVNWRQCSDAELLAISERR